jgi:hypothetical protein
MFNSFHDTSIDILVKLFYYPLMNSLGDNIWTLPLPFTLGGCQLGTKTTIVRSEGNLLLISPGPFTEAHLRALRELGEVTTLLAPNKMHHLYLSDAIKHFPKAQLILAPGLPEKRPDLSHQSILPCSLEQWGLEGQFVRGLPDLNETVFFHRPSRTLILTDLAFHFPKHSHLPTRLMLRLNGALGRFGPTRLLKHVFLKDKRLFKEDMARVMQWPIEKIVVGHGVEVLEGGLDRMKAAF